jgi:hypothetical protein
VAIGFTGVNVATIAICVYSTPGYIASVDSGCCAFSVVHIGPRLIGSFIKQIYCIGVIATVIQLPRLAY